ncbi:MAG: response regulator transcription factor [Oscillospiraceae bacterium]|nr:response regulator transcription factor [Oscillospiraceae bacterium]
MQKILLIEDDLQICEVIQKYFINKGTKIHAVQNGKEALHTVKYDITDHELILLDIMLPDTDGFTICREIRKNSDIPVIFITARAREEDILHGYAIGCDDYIIKPFLLSALYAKCDALIRRSQGTVTNTMLTCGAIRLDTRMLTCYVNEQEIELPPKQFAILHYLMLHKGWTVSREILLDRIWGNDYFGSDRVVDNHIKKLRKALGSAGGQIKTLVGRGYKLTEQ